MRTRRVKQSRRGCLTLDCFASLAMTEGRLALTSGSLAMTGRERGKKLSADWRG
ncbi:MAG: hypothetical protein LBT00_01925 [Spirochaetaceae bacterium]|nr:hypothetical protein [Spirochaetaceae bacterium]